MGGRSDATTQLVIIKWLLVVGIGVTVLSGGLIAVLVVPQALTTLNEVTLLTRSARAMVSDERISRIIGRADNISSDVGNGLASVHSISSAVLSSGLMDDLTTLQSVMNLVRKGVAVVDTLSADIDPVALVSLLQRERVVDKSLFLVTFTEALVRQNQGLFTSNITGTINLMHAMIENFKGALNHLQKDGITVKL